MHSLNDIELRDKIALVRADLNVPMAGKTITDDTRIRSSLPTLQAILAAGGGVLVLSHLGRPTEGQFDAALSLVPVATALAKLLGQEICLTSLDAASTPIPGNVMMLENTRFNKGEKSNDPQLARKYASLGDVFVMDAFASSHRAEASTVGLATIASQRCAGLLLQAEIDALGKALKNPRHPLLAIIGGAKVSTKLEVLEQLAQLADNLIVGGGIANTFLMAQGYKVGKSLVEPTMLAICQELLTNFPDKFYLPQDVIVARSLDAPTGTAKRCTDISSDELILDVGPKSNEDIQALVAQAGTIIWNGALGVFEQEAFSTGTRQLVTAIAAANAYSLAGGGETIAATNLYGLADRISYMSTGGGAFLEFVGGKELPGIQALH